MDRDYSKLRNYMNDPTPLKIYEPDNSIGYIIYQEDAFKSSNDERQLTLRQNIREEDPCECGCKTFLFIRSIFNDDYKMKAYFCIDCLSKKLKSESPESFFC